MAEGSWVPFLVSSRFWAAVSVTAGLSLLVPSLLLVVAVVFVFPSAAPGAISSPPPPVPPTPPPPARGSNGPAVPRPSEGVVATCGTTMSEVAGGPMRRASLAIGENSMRLWARFCRDAMGRAVVAYSYQTTSQEEGKGD